MQEPGSPEVKKPPVIEDDSKEYTQLVSYSIVIDVKSTVWTQEVLWLHIQLYIVHNLEKNVQAYCRWRVWQNSWIFLEFSHRREACLCTWNVYFFSHYWSALLNEYITSALLSYLNFIKHVYCIFQNLWIKLIFFFLFNVLLVWYHATATDFQI